MEELNALIQYRKSPQTAPRKLVSDLVARFDPGYTAIGLKDIGGEGAVIKVRNSGGEVSALKVALPNITQSYEDTHVWFALRFKKDRRNLDAERFREGVRLQKSLSRALRQECVPYLFVPEVIRAFESPTLAYEMCWVESVGVLDWLRDRKSLRYSMDLFRVLLECVLWLHSRGIVHRDLKSDNIMMAGEKALYLVDWTVSKCLIEERNLTQVGAAIGTFPNAAPKLLSHRMARDASYIDDLHSLGYIFWEFVSGKRLPRVSGDEFDEAFHRQYRDARAWEIEDPFRTVFLKATHPEESLRYQLLEDLDRAVAGAIEVAGLAESTDGAADAVKGFEEMVQEQCRRCTRPLCLGTGICRTIAIEIYRTLKFGGYLK